MVALSSRGKKSFLYNSTCPYENKLKKLHNKTIAIIFIGIYAHKHPKYDRTYANSAALCENLCVLCGKIFNR